MRDSVGLYRDSGLEGFGKEPIRTGSLIGVEGFESSLGFRFRDDRICHFAPLCVGGKREWTLFCTIETLKCLLKGICISSTWLQGSDLDGVDAGFWCPFVGCSLHEPKIL